MPNRDVLELFDKKKDFFDEKVNSGIERYRKGDAEIKLVTDGNAVNGAAIKLKQKTHEFRFGANLLMLDEFETQEKNEKYRKAFTELFNMGTVPFYWDALEPERGKQRYAKDSPKIYRRPATDLCVEFCEQNGIEPREHALAYERFFPSWLRGKSADEVKRELERRFGEIAERYADKIKTIEVTNEMEWLHGATAFYDEPDYIDWCFKTAQKYFPNNQLGINEWAGLCWGDSCRVTDKYYAYIEAAMLKGAKIDAIGMQYHLFNIKENMYKETRTLLDPESMYRHMNLYSNFKKPLQVTEVTVPSHSWEAEDEQVQAEIIDKLYSLWFSHPNVEQIIYWNLVDGYAYVEDATPENIKATQGNMSIGENRFYGGLLRFDLSPKPAYFKIKELTQERWHTEAEILSDAQGVAAFRGFYGDYELEITTDGRAVTKEISLSKNSDNKFVIEI